jgi:hypothetical protein
MPSYRRRTELPVSAPEAFAWHGRPGALERLLPPWQPVRLLERTPPAAPDGAPASLLAEGARVRLRTRLGPFSFIIRAEHGPLQPDRLFTDRGALRPWVRWMHAHRFVPRGDFACLLEDALELRLGPPGLGPLLGTAPALRALERLFRLRHARTAHDLARHAAYAGRPPLTVAVSGASGLVGRRLCAFLSAGGYAVLRLVRRATGAPDEIAWDPAGGGMDAAAMTALARAEAVVHLAGANLAAGRWSAARKRVLWDSRVEGTARLAETLARLARYGRGPRVLVCASAIGYYGDAGDKPVDERAPRGAGFLAELCEAWEAAAEPARQAGVRTVHVRTGIAIAGEGGVLAKLAPLFALGLGGPLGSGRQHMSWIALEDLLTVFLAALRQEDWNGPVNAVAPEAPTNAEFTRALARVLRRPAPFRAPAWAIRLGLGQLGREALLAGQRVVPAYLQRHGFVWRLPRLEDALAEELGREAPG